MPAITAAFAAQRVFASTEDDSANIFNCNDKINSSWLCRVAMSGRRPASDKAPPNRVKALEMKGFTDLIAFMQTR